MVLAACKHRIHRRHKLEEFLWVKEYLGKLLGHSMKSLLNMPRRANGTIASEFWRTPLVDVRPSSMPAASPKKGHKNATVIKRVNEPGGIPCEHPAIARKPSVPKREIPGSVDLGDAPSSRHLPDYFWVLLKNLGIGIFRL